MVQIEINIYALSEALLVKCGRKKKLFWQILFSDQLASIHETQWILLVSVLYPSSSWHHNSIQVQHLLPKEYPVIFVIYSNLKPFISYHKVPIVQACYLILCVVYSVEWKTEHQPGSSEQPTFIPSAVTSFM